MHLLCIPSDSYIHMYVGEITCRKNMDSRIPSFLQQIRDNSSCMLIMISLPLLARVNLGARTTEGYTPYYLTRKTLLLFLEYSKGRIGKSLLVSIQKHLYSTLCSALLAHETHPVFSADPYWNAGILIAIVHKLQWNPSNADTNGAEESVLYREVSLFQGLKCMQEWYLGRQKVSRLERCPQFRGVLIERFHCIYKH